MDVSKDICISKKQLCRAASELTRSQPRTIPLTLRSPARPSFRHCQQKQQRNGLSCWRVTRVFSGLLTRTPLSPRRNGSCFYLRDFANEIHLRVSSCTETPRRQAIETSEGFRSPMFLTFGMMNSFLIRETLRAEQTLWKRRREANYFLCLNKRPLFLTPFILCQTKTAF